MTGDFRQGTAAGRFRLHRTVELPAVVRTPPADFREEEVKIFNGPVTLAGTLSMPLGSGPFPAAILLTGSGAQNRDEEIFGFAPFRILAEYLTRRGFAVLRCDDRGVGGSTGDMQSSTSADFATDAMAMLKSLKSRPEIRVSQIGLIGHSEGAMVATMCAAGSGDIAFLVLLAGPAVPGDSLILSQIDVLGRLSGQAPEEISRNQASERRVFATVRAQKGWEDLRRFLRAEMLRSLDQLPAEQKAAVTNPDSVVDVRLDFQMKAVQTPWFRFFISHDPVPDLLRVHCPVLALYGDLDKQVDLALNNLRMTTALTGNGNSDVRVVTIPGANHLFQRAVTGHPAEYPRLDKTFAEGVLGEISTWLKKHFPP
jgi:pimeloyl-ACP methyl ester carboxylesterase